MGIDGRCLFYAESVTSFGTPFSILVCERFLGVSADTLAVPELSGKIHPFLAPIRIPGSTFEQGIEARKRSIQQRNQIVFEIDLTKLQGAVVGAYP